MTTASKTLGSFKTWDGYRNGQLVARFHDQWRAEKALENHEIDSITPTVLAVGLFVQETLVTDTRVYEVIAVTPKTIKIRSTCDGPTVKSENRDGNPWPVVHKEALPDHRWGVVRTVRLRKDGTYRLADWAHPLRPATIVDGKPVTFTDYRY